MGCTMEIILKKTFKKEESKTEVSASLKAEYDALAYGAKGSSGLKVGGGSKKDNSNTDISIKYTGNNDNVFMDGLS